jgi:hypothetical protein
MKDIHEVLRRKQAQYAQLGRQIEALQGAAEKMREIAPLLADESDAAAEVVLPEMDEVTPVPSAKAASAAAQPAAPSAAPAKSGRGVVPRWP